MKQLRHITIALVIIFNFSSLIYNPVTGQNIDSLKQVIKASKIDSTKIKLYIEIGDYYYFGTINDTALIYYEKAINLSDENLKSSHSPANVFFNLKATALRYSGITYSAQGNYDKAIEFFSKSLKIKEKLNDKKGMSASYNNIGSMYYRKGLYKKAIEYYLKSLEIKEELGDKKGMSASYNNIGLVYGNQGIYDKAIEYHLKALKINEEIGNKIGISYAYGNLGNVNYSQKLYDKAISYYLKSLKIKEELGDKIGMSNSYGNIGNVYAEQKLYNKSIEFYLKTLKIKEELGDKHGIAVAYVNIAALHMDIVRAENTGAKRKSHLQQALEYGNKAYDLALEVHALPLLNDASEHLRETYRELGNYAEAIEYGDVYIATQDSMFNTEKTKALAEMQTKYEADKKQLEIEKLENQKQLDQKAIEIKNAENKKQQIIIFFMLACFVIVLVFSIIILRMFRHKKIANILLAEQKAEIETQRDTVISQKDRIEEIHQELTDSIFYAKHIQQAVLPSNKFMNELLSEYFVYFKPLSIVSGDFYWTTKIDNMVIFTVADCTGHGVPGAFMSMLGISFLNEIVIRSEITQSNQVLNKLRDNVISALNQKGVQGESTDGMDISFCVLNKETNILQWSGANNPLYLVRNGELIEFRSDKMPISIHRRMDPYKNHEIQLQKNDVIYLFTDGFPDQFGGDKGRKFKYKPFKELLINISGKAMDEQSEILNTTLNKWKGNHAQIDDITIMGVRI